MMKLKNLSLLVLAIPICLLAAGCNSASTTSQTTGTQARRMVSPAQDPSLPQEARQRAAQQAQQKSQMDAMRAADAAKSK